MNALIIFYSFIDRMLAKVGLENFHMINYTVSGKITLLNRDYIGNGGYFFAGWICICGSRSLFGKFCV